MLVLGTVLGEPLGAAVKDEPGRPARGTGQDRVLVGDAAVADPLLAAVQPVSGDRPAVQHGSRGCLQRGEVAARVGLRRTVGVQDAAFGDLGEPLALLLWRGADEYRVAAEEGGEHAGGDPHVEPGHLLADPVDVDRAAAHPAVFLGDEQQLDAQLVAAHAPDQVNGALIVVVELEQPFVGERVADEVPDGLQHHGERLGVEAGPRLEGILAG